MKPYLIPWRHRQRGFLVNPYALAVTGGGGVLARTNLLGQRGTGGTTFNTSNITTVNSSLLVVAIGVTVSGGASDPSGDITLSGGGLTYTSRLVIGSAVPWSRGIRIFTAPVTTGATFALALGCGGATIHTWDAHAFSYTGANIASPVGVSASSNTIAGGAGPQTLTLSGAPATSSEVLAVIHTNPTSASSPITPTSPWIEQYDIGSVNIQMQTQTRAADASTPVSWSGVGATYNNFGLAAAIEIRV